MFILLKLSIVLLLICSGCQSMRDVQYFRLKKHEAFYRAEKRAGKSIIKYNFDENRDVNKPYQVQPGDELRIRFLNFPAELIESSANIGADGKYIVNLEGFVFTPIVGKVYVKDKTTQEIETELYNKYKKYYPEPSIDVSVANLRIYLYGEVKNHIVILPSEKTHLLEALALAGGLNYTAKQSKIKIIRGDLSNPKILWVDLGKLDGLSSEDLYMKSGDIIYVEAYRVQRAFREITPYLTLITIIPTILFTIQLIRGR